MFRLLKHRTQQTAWKRPCVYTHTHTEYGYPFKSKGYFSKYTETVTKSTSIIDRYFFTGSGQMKQRKFQGCHLRGKLKVSYKWKHYLDTAKKCVQRHKSKSYILTLSN